jgi:serine beta-lactamase-like protein LACTB
LADKKSRTQAGLALIAAAIGLLFAAGMGLWVYVSATAKPLHPNPEDIASVIYSDPQRQWTGAVEQARRIARESLNEQNLPGLSVAVGAGGAVVWAEGFGFANLETRAPVAPNTQFRIGTASMALTSAALGLLMEQDRLDLDDVIQKHVPEFPDKPWPVTLLQLMGHVAGVKNDGGDEGPLFSERCEKPADALPHFAASSLVFEPGTEFRPSSYGWVLLSAAIESAAKEPFLRFMRKQVFEPAGMDDTRAELTPEPAPDQATSYFPRFAADPRYGPDLMRELNYSCYAGASVFLSTPTDLVRFAMAVNSGKLLAPATVQLLQASQRLRSGEETGYGLGWDLEAADVGGKQVRIVGHDGDVLGGQAASFITLPELGLVVAVTTNTSYADTFGAAVKIAQAFAAQAR